MFRRRLLAYLAKILYFFKARGVNKPRLDNTVPIDRTVHSSVSVEPICKKEVSSVQVVKKDKSEISNNAKTKFIIKANKDLSQPKDLNFDNFFQEILSYYGYPSTASSCRTKEEKIMYAYAFFAAKMSLNQSKRLWKESYASEKVSEFVDIFCEQFYNEFGHHVIPSELDVKNNSVFNMLKIGPQKETNKEAQDSRENINEDDSKKK